MLSCVRRTGTTRLTPQMNSVSGALHVRTANSATRSWRGSIVQLSPGRGGAAVGRVGGAGRPGGRLAPAQLAGQAGRGDPRPARLVGEHVGQGEPGGGQGAVGD